MQATRHRTVSLISVLADSSDDEADTALPDTDSEDESALDGGLAAEPSSSSEDEGGSVGIWRSRVRRPPRNGLLGDSASSTWDPSAKFIAA